MITTKTFESGWITQLSLEFGKGKRSNPELVEKVTKALHLLELLSLNNLEFIFKGGTSLLLLLDDIHRFSIDIDIILEQEKTTSNINILREKCNEIISQSEVFTRWEEDERGGSDIPKAHYKFYYVSAINPIQPHYILLDVLFENSHYEETVFKSTNCKFIDYEDPEISVRMPSVESILGDKLTAFAPLTTGIPYAKGKELEIIKQLFDIENLFNEIEDLNTVNETFARFAAQELRYRQKNDLNSQDVLRDILNTSLIICAQGAVCKDEYSQLQDGVNRIKDFIFSKSYIMRDALISASKTAYLSQLLLTGNSKVERFSNQNMSDWKIDNPISVREDGQVWRVKNINNVKKTSAEAYFYLYKTFELITE